MGLFQPVTDIGQHTGPVADRRLIPFGQPCLDIDEFGFHDPDLQFDQMDRHLQGSRLVGRGRGGVCAGGNI